MRKNMTIKQLRSKIKKASENQKLDGITAYISYMSDDQGNESLCCNFIDLDFDHTITDDQLIKLEEEGLLEKDWDTLIIL